jgi:hypothetical protein|tara:strand:- start:7312 stop:7527 length:216 start_codon:yes stop_codon:yes gene_type:complete
MAGKRILIDLFIPDNVYSNISSNKKTAFRDTVRDMKSKAIMLNNDATVKATIHDCRHDEGLPCDPKTEKDI